MHKIILFLIATSTLVFLLFATYVTNSFSSFSKPYYEENKQGLFEIIKDDNTFSLLEKIDSNSGSVFLKTLNTSDKVIFSYGEVQTKYSSGNILIDITPGIYSFQLKEINSNYIISGEGFKVNNRGPGKIIINNLNPRKIIVFSMDTIVNLDLLLLKTNEKVTSVSLYPTQYLVFNPLKNIFVKNSDLLKIYQTFTLGFFNNEITNSEQFLNLILLKNKKGEKLIEYSINFYKNEIDEKNKHIKDYLNSTFGTLPGEELIAKYSNLFINTNKESLYYKNMIIRKTNDLLKTQNIDIKIINDINNYIDLLSQVNEEGSKEMKNFIVFYYINVIISNDSPNSKVNFSKLINKINNENSSSNYLSLIYLEQIFNNSQHNTFYKDINKFTNEYFDDLNISIDSTDDNKLNIYEIKDIDYLLYFLENIMLNSESSGFSNIGDIIYIFNNYVKISNSFYSHNSEETKRIGLFTNSKILNKFIEIIEKEYFIDNDNILLEIKPNINIVKNNILLFETNINKIFTFFNQNKIVLKEKSSTKDKFLIKKIYPGLEKTFEEYFYALKDYEGYLSVYDLSKKELLTTKTVNEQVENIELNIEYAKNYIELFNGVKLIDADIKIMDYNYCLNPVEKNENIELKNPYCYKINNLSIDKQIVSFILYPFLENKIDNIIIGGKSISGTYKLNNIEKELEKKLKTVKKDREQYMFTNFLLNTFGRKLALSNNNNTQIINEVVDDESPVIKIFKRNKLLGELGDFNKISGFLNIVYDNLKVKKESDIYIININSALFNLSISKDISYRGLFSSNYDFSKKHSFINPKLQLLEKKSEKYLLLGNYIYITGEYKVNDVENEIKDFFTFYNQIEFTVNTISKSLDINIIDIFYDKKSKIISFKSIYNGSELIIQLLDSNIINTSYDGDKIIENKMNYKGLESILNTITK